MLTVYMGFDPKEVKAYMVAAFSCHYHASEKVRIMGLDKHDLYQRRLLTRPTHIDGEQIIDHISDAPQSTEFAISRFLTPMLHGSGWCLFVDCDMVFMDDVAKLFELADDRYAVMVVKHEYEPNLDDKMCGQKQTSYTRKNWSSVILWNCSHVANQRLTLGMVNTWPGLLLHQFAWLRDDEIGELPGEWNWLVNEQPKPAEPKLAHYTRGGPWFEAWQTQPHDNIWRKYEQLSSESAKPNP